ncbi:MAG: ABC transporter ATP-binding protein [Spirochaetales bacterium]
MQLLRFNSKPEKTRYLLRALGCLKPYKKVVVSAYAAAFAVNALHIWIPLIIGGVIDDGIRAGVSARVFSGVGLLMTAALAKAVLTYLIGVWSENASQSVAYDLRNRFHQKLQQLSFSFHDDAETGQLLARSIQDVDRIRFLTGRAVLNLVQLGTQIVGVTIAMLIIELRLALLTITVFPVLIISTVQFGSTLRTLTLTLRDREATLTGRVEQNLRAQRIVKAFGREDTEITRFDEANRSLLETQKREARVRALFLPFMQLLAGIGTLLVLVGGGRMVVAGTLSIGVLVAFMTYLSQLLMPIRRFGWLLSAVAQASAGAERIFEILDLPSDVQDAPDAEAVDEVRGEICFNNVSFSYAKSRQVLQGLSFCVGAGEKLAVLGATGSGKSSIINLIPRFYDPTDGEVTIDGRDVREMTLQSLRSHIGIVLQETVLFAASIEENIALGRPNASHKDIVQAAQAAHIHAFIESLPDGYATPVGERGVTLSGGQKQRVAIARAILKDPKILILDDATSSVDTETEQQIQEAMEGLMQGRTSVIIAQRLSTVRTADQVIVLDHGRVATVAHRSASMSPHEQLLRESGLYAEIVRGQRRDANEDVRS